MDIYYCKRKDSYVLSFKEYIIRSAFQAIVDTDENTIGYEALSRIHIGSSDKNIRPDIFFNFLKKDECCYELLFLINKLHVVSYRKSRFYSNDKKLFINLPPDFFERIRYYPHIVDDINNMFKEYDISRNNVVAEITEGHAVCKLSLAIGAQLLSRQGYKIALDDYGNEASDFERYEMCKPEVVKISREFFLMQKYNRDYAELKILIDTFKGRSSKILVEGIEFYDDYEMLFSLGIDYFQGFYFHKPECVSSCILVA